MNFPASNQVIWGKSLSYSSTNLSEPITSKTNDSRLVSSFLKMAEKPKTPIPSNHFSVNIFDTNDKSFSQNSFEDWYLKNCKKFQLDPQNQKR
eukprot:TRINITY_DN3030_c4_g17_i1.p1 TRINITY_DN3030_c4_g17~~TRINITY_DN3030_c4_g17_i1.p1  ORF type:complete len:93 (+),score=19.54 TRINITY_DN3030_c4_g17_i1:31-309(+)